MSKRSLIIFLCLIIGAGVIVWTRAIHEGVLEFYVFLCGIFWLVYFLGFAAYVKVFEKRFLTWLFVIFVSAFILRYSVILNTAHNKFIDLSIYMNGGQLLSYSINPYDHLDNVEMRNNLRLAEGNDPWVSKTQERWDYYASSNLPLTLLVFGLIDRISPGPQAYRIVFAFFDSLVGVVIALFLLKFWGGRFGNTAETLSTVDLVFVTFILSVLSPVFLVWGTYYPEDKGIQILFMVSALLFSSSENRLIRTYFSSFILGASIAFKGLGIFLVPLCVYYAVFESATVTKEKIIEKLDDTLFYLFLSTFFTFMWFLPFAPYVVNMMVERLRSGTQTLPIHASIWRLVYLLTYDYWVIIRDVVFSFIVLLTTWGALKKRIGLEIVCANILLSFVVLLLTAGSLDRMHIGILMATLLVGVISPKQGFILALYNFVAGTFIYTFQLFVYRFFKDNLEISGIIPVDGEFIESVYALFFIILYFAFFIKMVVFSKTPIKSR